MLTVAALGLAATTFQMAAAAGNGTGPSMHHRLPFHPRPQASTLPTPIFAGGGSVPATMLRNWGNLFGVTPGQPAQPSKANVEMLFASTNGPAGERYLINQAFDAVNTPSSSPAYTDTTNGRDWLFPYPTGSPPATSPDYVIGSPLSIVLQTQYNSQTLSQRGKAIQLPIVEAGIALAYNLGPDASLGSRPALLLSRKSYCGIYTGTITDWSDPQITQDNGGTPVVSAPTQIDAVYRADSAGSTFILTTHFNDICAKAGVPYGQGVSETFALPNPVPPASNFVGATGNTALINDVLIPANPAHGALGYTGPSSIKPNNPSGPPAASLINRAGVANQPTVAAVKEAFLKGPYTGPPPGWAPRPHTYVPDPKGMGSYPISGLIFMLFYHCFPAGDPDVPAMQAFFDAAMAPQVSGLTAYDKIAEAAGLAELSNVRKKTVRTAMMNIELVPPMGTCH
jgi:ABC-type phosphate transport system substrate-binding protein